MSHTDRFVLRRTPFDWPLALFLLTAVGGVWVAYNRTAAASKFWLLLIALMLFYMLAGQPVRNLTRITGLLAALAVLVAIFFLLSHDWRAFPVKFQLVNRISQAWMAVRPEVGFTPLHPNVAGSLMAMLWPFFPALALVAYREQQRGRLLAITITAVFVLAALMLSGARGAWLSLAAAVGIWFLWLVSGQLSARLALPRRPLFIFLLFIPALAALLFAGAYPGGPIALLDRLPGPNNAGSRLALGRNTLHLIVDVPFTGGGLAAFPGLYSQYILLIPFYFLPNGHNIFLDAVLEQGIPGGAALAAVLLGSGVLLARPSSASAGENSRTALRWATFAGLLVMVLHGQVEDTIYGSPALPLLFLFPGLAVALTASVPDRRRLWAGSRPLRLAIGVTLLLLAITTITLFRQPLQAAWYANLGSIEMARVELADWPKRAWDDGRNVSALANAETLFGRALATDPANQTAHYRLGLITMLARDYGPATRHLELAHAATPDHQGIIKALAFSYSWAGEYENGLEMLLQVPTAVPEMRNYVSWWRSQGRADLSERAAEMVGRLEEIGRLSER